MKKDAVFMKKFTALSLALLASCAAYGAEANCEDKIFSSFSANKGTQIVQVIDQLSAYCGFSIIVKDDETDKQLERNLNTVNLKNFSLTDILNFVLNENNFDYEYKNNVLKIFYMTTKTFKVDYLRTVRNGSGNTDVSVSGSSSSTSATTTGSSATTSSSGSGGSGGGGGGSSANSGRTNITSNDANFDFWATIGNDINGILASGGTKSATVQTPQAAAPAPSNPLDPNAPLPPTIASIAPTTVLSTSTPSSAAIINKEAGLITVTAPKEKLKKVEQYIETLMERLHRQVLIDVKILSVNLDNSKKTGIDWSKLELGLKHNSQATNAGSGNLLKDLTFGNTMTVLNSVTFSMDGLIKFLGSYGDVKSLSNPKILALNNQPALISSGDRYYYLTTGTTTSAAGTTGTTATNTAVDNVFAGIMLDITPEILDDDTILIKINPAITTPRDTASITSSSTQNAAGTSTAVSRSMPPDMKVKQISSVAKVRDGEKIILGGLISDDNEMKTTKIPILGDIPIFGYLFKSEAEVKNFSELVIIITPHIVKKDKLPTLNELGFKSF